jgi:hypothetical protein
MNFVANGRAIAWPFCCYGDQRAKGTFRRSRAIHKLALLWQIFWVDRRNWIPESGFQ